MRQNPWPENSDYGKLWRMGYRAGKSDAVARLVQPLMRCAEWYQQHGPRSQSNKVSKPL